MNATLDQLKERIEFFRKNIKDYKSGKYDEYKTRADFIDVFFSSLDWDMYNEQKIIEQFREVVREDKIVIDGSRKAPDYSFRIGPHIVFYVEAKKPSIDIKNDPAPALQLRRYAHTRGLALSILTDFEEIAVYDTRIKPDKKDSAHTARLFYCTYDELFSPCKIQGYSSNYEFLFNTFGKQAVLSGSFNRYVEANKKGTASVDRGFLDLLNRWREKLAESIALKNEDIDEYNLNIVVQKLIDRLIFLRIAEDRLIEKPNLLLELTGEKDIYTRLCNIFVAADLKYNSSLFLSEDWMMALNVEDKTLKEIIDEMYPPQCPYEFSVLPIEILGHAYEQFLGKTIRFFRKTKFGHSVEIEEKPEVRKAGGVYYTPDYIVDYIVENTVGVKLNGVDTPGPRNPKGGKADKGAKPLTPEEVSEIKILDPACGSGSFLIGAYNYLLRYHLEYYLKNKTRREKALSAGIIYESGNNSFKLSTKVKSQILVNNIFGVDIDQQAVEVTKLSLLLKVLEDENLEYKDQLFKTEQMHLLPDLSCNIKCGNSLIGSDYYEDKNLTMFGTEEMRKVNVFDWEKEFMTSPPAPLRTERGDSEWGFDCVIGNPPYIYVRELISDDNKSYFSKVYESYEYQSDMYLLFIEKSMKLINKNGFIGLIIPNSWLGNINTTKIRKMVLSNYSIKSIVYCPKETFGVNVETVILILDKYIEENIINVSEYDSKTVLNTIGVCKQSEFDKTGKNRLNLRHYKSNSILSKIEKNSFLLETFFDITRGVNAYDKYRGQSEKIIKERAYHASSKLDNSFSPELKGKHVGRYYYSWNGDTWIKYGNWLAAPREPKFFTGKRIILRQIPSERLLSTLIDEDFIIDQTVFIAKPNSNCLYNLRFILGILNSALMSFYFKTKNDETDSIFPKVKIENFKQFPIAQTYNSDAKYNQMIQIVESMLESQKQLQAAKSDSDKKLIQQKIDAIDKQIDRLVYELYGLTEDEIRIVEGAG